jgi:hypothetical protein
MAKEINIALQILNVLMKIMTRLTGKVLSKKSPIMTAITPNKQCFSVNGFEVRALNEFRLIIYDPEYELSGIEIDKIINYCINEGLLSAHNYDVLIKRIYDRS